MLSAGYVPAKKCLECVPRAPRLDKIGDKFYGDEYDFLYVPMKTVLFATFCLFCHAAQATGWSYEGYSDDKQKNHLSLMIGDPDGQEARILPLQGFVEIEGGVQQLPNGACSLFQDSEDFAILCGRKSPKFLKGVVYVLDSVKTKRNVIVLKCVRSCGKLPKFLYLDNETD